MTGRSNQAEERGRVEWSRFGPESDRSEGEKRMNRPRSASIERTVRLDDDLKIIMDGRHEDTKRPQSAKPRRKIVKERVLEKTVERGRRPKSAGPGGRTRRNRYKNFEYLQKREDGWNSGFVLENALDLNRPETPGRKKVKRKKVVRKKSLRKVMSEHTLRKRGPDVMNSILADNKRGGGDTKNTGLTKKVRKKKLLKSKKKKSLFRVLCDEITSLWEELHIPTRDRDFFWETYCDTKGSKAPLETMERLREQRDLLLKHRELTLDVLRKIQIREDNLSTLRQLSVDTVCKHKEQAGLASSSGQIEQLLQDLERDKFIQAVDDLRKSTIDIVRAIMRWRTLLWRPHPFIWQGINYLIKLQDDARFFGKTVDHFCTDHILFTDASTNYASNFSLHENASGPEDLFSSEQQDGDSNELEKIKTIIHSEAQVQCELRAEHKRLLEAGYYIPMLKWSPQEKPQEQQQEREENHVVHEEDENEEDENGVDSEPAVYDDQGSVAETGEDYCLDEFGQTEDDVLSASKKHMDLLQRIRNQIETN